MTFGTRLRELRRGKYTQRALARLAGLDATYISKLEHDVDRPSADAVVRLATVLGADPEELLALAGRPSMQLRAEAINDPRVGDLVRRLPTMDPTRRSAVFAAGGVGRQSALLVDATFLAEWADRRDAQGLLPQVVQRLILATGARVRAARFRSGDGINLPGWDGFVEVEEATAFIPEGTSGWEIGTSRGIKAKADDDFAARTRDPEGIDPTAASFVFVTPRRWSRKDKWTADQRRISAWREVRVLDADDLAAWLVQAPAVHVWLSTEVGKLPVGTRSLDFAWREWSEACSPPLSRELTLAGRDAAAVDIRQVLEVGSGIRMIRGDSADEAIAFIAAVVHSMDPPAETQVLGRTVVCDTPEAWRSLAGPSGPLILIAPFVPVDAAQAVEQGHLVLLACGRDVVGTDVIELPRPHRKPVRDALARMLGSIEQTERDRRTEELASIGRRSLLALRRRLAISPALSLPPWATGESPRDLLPMMLAGGWQEDAEADQRVVAELAGRPYAEVERRCAWLSTRPDPPIRRDGSAWVLASKEDLWALLGPLLTATDIAALGRAAQAVLGLADPVLDLPRSERWMAGVRGLARPHSELLRQGLAESILLLAMRTEPVAGAAPQARADGIVASLLTAANADRTAKLWSSVRDVLPTLAEAAPERFLEAVDRGLSGSEPVLGRLFTVTENEPVFAPGPETTGLLWALETLAWHPDYLARAATALARLDALDPGIGNWSNRPSQSLREIFLPWHPGTSADLIQRLAVLDLLRRRSPATAWNLLAGLLPKLHDVAAPTHGPARRDWQAGPQSPVTYAETFESSANLVSRLVDDAQTDARRWIDLVDALASLPPPSRAIILDRLEATTFEHETEGGAALGEHLRGLVAKHRWADEARWRLPNDELARLEVVGQMLQSHDPVSAAAWLFSPRPALSVPMSKGLKAYDDELTELRQATVSRLLLDGGLDDIERLAHEVVEPFALGFTVASLVLEPSDDDRLVDGLQSSDRPHEIMSVGYVAGRHFHLGWSWTDTALNRIGPTWPPEGLGAFLDALRPSRAVWDWAAQLGEHVDRAYWSRLTARLLEDPDEVLFAVGKLLDVGRGIVAVDLLSAHLEPLSHPDSDGVVIDALRAASTDEAADRSDVTMLGWNVARLLDFLEAAPEPRLAELAELEFRFLALLRYGDRPAKVLHRELASNPEFFLEVLSIAFRGDDEEPRELSEPGRDRARTAYELLDSWERAPGASDDNHLDVDALQAWVRRALELAGEAHRSAIGAQQIGRALWYAPPGSDGIRPPEPVRELLEELEDHELEVGLEIEIQNSRGATWRDPTDGGRQERELADRYRADARVLQDRWHRTAALLLRVAETYERDARREDDDAALSEDTEF